MQSPSGVVCSLRPNSPSIYFAPPDSIPNFLPMPNLKAPPISPIHRYTHGSPASSSTKNQLNVALGPRMGRWMVHWSHHGPLPMLPSMDPIYPCQTHSGYSPIFPTILRTPNLSHHDATQQAARELTHALQNANPLSQLSDDQLRALHHLSTLFPPIAPAVDDNSSPAPSPSPSPSFKPRYNLRPRPHYTANEIHPKYALKNIGCKLRVP